MAPPLLKICGLRDPDQAAAVAALGVDGVGVIGVRSSPRLSQIQKMKAARRAEMAAVSKFSEPEADDNREGKARAPTGEHNFT